MLVSLGELALSLTMIFASSPASNQGILGLDFVGLRQVEA